MKYSQEMILQSPSGYCMPFEEHGKDVEMIIGYGKQKSKESDVEFFNHGVDFKAPRYILSAIASGHITGIGNDSSIGNYQIIRYGDYDVAYGHLSNILVGYGVEVRAGQPVSISDKSVHIEVKYKNEELNPIEFLTMIYGNIKATENHKKQFSVNDLITPDWDFRTKYDSDRKEIEDLLLRFFPIYMNDLGQGAYTLPQRTEQSLRNILTAASARNYFFETLPSIENPMGLGHRSIPLAEKVQTLLIEDFLSYLALKHNTYLSSMNEEVKKNFFRRQ